MFCNAFPLEFGERRGFVRGTLRRSQTKEATNVGSKNRMRQIALQPIAGIPHPAQRPLRLKDPHPVPGRGQTLPFKVKQGRTSTEICFTGHQVQD